MTILLSISEKVQNVSVVSEENAAMSEEVSASSEEQNAVMYEIVEKSGELNKLGIELRGEIANLKI